MGFFSKETCAICGKQTRFSKTKLADGNYICGNCLGKTYYSHNSLNGVFGSTKFEFKNLTLNDINALYEIRKQNLEELKTFNCTNSFGLEFQVDENSKQFIFADYFTCTNKEKLLASNPPVFKLENLAFMHLTFSEIKESQTVTLKATAQSQAYLILGFVDPVFDILKVEIGKIKAKEGFLFDKVKGTKKIEKTFDSIKEMHNEVIMEANAKNILVPANDIDAFWKMLSRAYNGGYITSSDVNDYLMEYCGKDKNMMREIRNSYGI